MEKGPLIEWVWHGHETIESIPLLLDGAEQIEIFCPPITILIYTAEHIFNLKGN